MTDIGKILKALLAIALVAGMLIFGFFIFATLFGIACITGIVMWARGKQILQPRDKWGNSKDSYMDDAQDDGITIIEGKAEEVTLAGAAR